MDEDLLAPRKSVELEDSGAHELAEARAESSDGSDHFVDAAEESRPQRSGNASPIPVTRVERVDDEPTYGEVPGTQAYKMRSADAVPDEVEIVPDGQRSRSSSRIRPEDLPSVGAQKPMVPKIVAEKIDPDEPAYGDVPGTAAYELRKADAKPDKVVRSPDSASPPQNPWNESPTHSISRSPVEVANDTESIDDAVVKPLEYGSAEYHQTDTSDTEEEEEGFGDDFDDFEEGQEDGDFGDFGSGFQQQAGEIEAQPKTVPIPLPSFPVLDYSDLGDPESIEKASKASVSALFPSINDTGTQNLPQPPRNIFLSDRSLSLYTQLTAPPPLAPPDWLRSRIRRLFLVSLGVPVDLDEILPASKQKKLILPSIHLIPGDGRSPRTSTDSPGAPANGAVSRLKGHNDSFVSVDSKGNRRRRRDEPTRPELDLPEARRVGGTTDIRLQGMSDQELRDHVGKLETMVERAEELLLYWQRRREGALKEKEAFEGVIENLVRHARKVRK